MTPICARDYCFVPVPLRRLFIVCFVPRQYFPVLAMSASAALMLSPLLDFFFDDTIFFVVQKKYEYVKVG